MKCELAVAVAAVKMEKFHRIAVKMDQLARIVVKIIHPAHTAVKTDL